MAREERLTKPGQYTLVHDKGNTYSDRFLVIKTVPNLLEFSRYGISVSKRIGTAVVRNRTKRILREILKLAPLAPGLDIIIIARAPAARSNYRQLQQSVTDLLSRAYMRARQQ